MFMRMKDNSLAIAHFLLKAFEKTEENDLNRWKSISKENSSFVDLLQAFWTHPGGEKKNDGLNNATERLITRINTTQHKPIQRTILLSIIRIAAIFILVVSITAFLSIFVASKMEAGTQLWVEVSTESGKQSKVTLPDGTLVWLNTETTLKYQSNSKSVRKVKLIGEAYFEVEHSANHPFIVDIDDASVKVLGTKFNVSHYSDSKITQVALLSGKISMTESKTGKEVELNPGEMVIFNSEQKVFSKSACKVQNEISWKDGILHFENEPFNTLIQRLERQNGIKFIYDAKTFGHLHYSGTLDNLEISRVLDFINLTIPIHYEVKNKFIVLKLSKTRLNTKKR